MFDVAVLRSRMRSLSGPQQPILHAGRVLDIENPYASLIAEIEETQLPRILVFTNDRAESISCFVRAGRLLSVEHLNASNIRSLPEETCAPNADQISDPDEIQSFLRRFLSNVSQLIVYSLRSEFGGALDHEDGCQLSLSEVLGTQIDKESSLTSALLLFSQRCSSLVDACVVLHGEEFHTVQGDPDLVDPLRALAKAEASAITVPKDIGADPVGVPECAIYSGHPSGGRSVFCAKQSHILLLASCRYDQVGALVELWQDCLRV